MRQYLGGWAEKTGIDMNELLQLGILPGEGTATSTWRRSVSGWPAAATGSPGSTARSAGTCLPRCPGGKEITSVTNGVHARTWVTPQLQRLFDEKLETTEWHLPDRARVEPGGQHHRR